MLEQLVFPDLSCARTVSRSAGNGFMFRLGGNGGGAAKFPLFNSSLKSIYTAYFYIKELIAHTPGLATYCSADHCISYKCVKISSFSCTKWIFIFHVVQKEYSVMISLIELHTTTYLLFHTDHYCFKMVSMLVCVCMCENVPVSRRDKHREWKRCSNPLNSPSIYGLSWAIRR